MTRRYISSIEIQTTAPITKGNAMSLSLNTAAIRSSCQPKPASLFARIGHFFTIARQRRALATLEPHLLKDIGVTPAQVDQEAAKPGWDVPNHWHH
jgi:uncharacterized protein YjiS (DUF1127 family)